MYSSRLSSACLYLLWYHVVVFHLKRDTLNTAGGYSDMGNCCDTQSYCATLDYGRGLQFRLLLCDYMS